MLGVISVNVPVPSVSAFAGVVSYAGVGIEKFYLSDQDADDIMQKVQYQVTSQVALVAGISVDQAIHSNNRIEELTITEGDSGVKYVGIGFGLSLGATAKFPIKIGSVSNDFSELRSELDL